MPNHGPLDMSVKDLRLDMVCRGDALRPLVETFACKVYRKRYGANLNTFCNELLTLISARYGVISCVGVNTGEPGSFFLEQYLDRPVEEEIARHINEDVDRNTVVEVGTMGVLKGGLCRLIMAGLAGYLTQQGKRFIVCTAVKSIRNTFINLNIPFHTITAAGRDRLQRGAADWGSYYDAGPEVIFIDLGMCRREIENVLENIAPGISDNMRMMLKNMYQKGMSLKAAEGYAAEESLKCGCGMP